MDEGCDMYSYGYKHTDFSTQVINIVVIPTPSIRITLSLRVPAALSVEGFLLVRYSISGIARCVKYRRLVAFIVYLKTTVAIQ